LGNRLLAIDLLLLLACQVDGHNHMLAAAGGIWKQSVEPTKAL
jgi:hypothetical protein